MQFAKITLWFYFVSKKSKKNCIEKSELYAIAKKKCEFLKINKGVTASVNILNVFFFHRESRKKKRNEIMKFKNHEFET